MILGAGWWPQRKILVQGHFLPACSEWIVQPSLLHNSRPPAQVSSHESLIIQMLQQSQQHNGVNSIIVVPSTRIHSVTG